MGRGPKPAKGKAQPAVPRKSRANEDSKVRDLEKRLAEALGQLQTRDRELAEAHEQQTATAEILRVISQAPGDLQPVLTAVAQNAARLCDARDVAIVRLDGGLLRMMAGTGAFSEMLAPDYNAQNIPATRGSVTGRAITDRMTIHVHDLAEESETDYPHGRALQKRYGHRTMLATPLRREGLAIGAISICRFEVRPFSESQIALLQTFADQAVIAIENVRLFTELQEKNEALTKAHAHVNEALERQTATGEILGVIASSPTDVQPVYDAIVRSAVTLCGATLATVYRREGDLVHLVGIQHQHPHAVDVAAAYPAPVTSALMSCRAILENGVIHLPDVDAEGALPPEGRRLARLSDFRSVLSVPMRRQGHAIGAILVGRPVLGRFPDEQIALLQTFADQAVIAIENTRLFNETKEALERQTATSEILRVISSSPTDTQPVFDIIAASAARLCAARDAQVLRVEGDVLRLVSACGSPSMPPVRTISRGHGVGRAVVDRQTIHVRDMVQAIAEFPETSAPQHGVESILAVPLLREDVAVGVIRVSRTQRQPFTEQQIALLQTFADQAVIAIENVRLFKELETRNHDLTDALARQTSTSEILRVISRSPTNVQPVFDSIVESAVTLCDGLFGGLVRFDGELIHPVATHNYTPEALDAMRRIFPARPSRALGVGRAILDRDVVHLPDIELDPEYQVRSLAGTIGFRSGLFVPMLRDGAPIGAILVARAYPGPFSDNQIALLKTFADQAVIAIENVRLFKELEAANRELAAASQHKSEFLANMSHELRTPLNAIIGFSEVLSEKMFGELNEKQEEYSKDIHASGEHLLSLINDILDLSKIEAGRMELELSDFDFPTAIDNALMLIRERSGRRSIALQTSIDDRLGQVQADERKVRQVVLNLLSNAIKFTPEGGRIEVSAAPKDGLVEVSVSDTGIGIAPEDQEKVFEEFRQVGTAAKKIEGTGLGLTLCRKFVELHGGKIWVKSQLGEGSTFTFTIPVRRAE